MLSPSSGGGGLFILLLHLGNGLMDGLGHIVDVFAGQTAHVDATTVQ